MLTEDDLEKILQIINEEGFDYTFLFHSKFEHVDDEEFHRLRKAFINAARELQYYLWIDTDEIDQIHAEKPLKVC